MKDYKAIKSSLADFLETYKKEAEDPNRAALTPEDIKEGKPATTEVDKGDGTQQGAAGTETTKEIKANLPPGTAVGEGASTATSPEAKAQTEFSPATTTESGSPEDDMEEYANQPEALKKAAAAQIRFEVGLMNMIDNLFETQASKTASEDDVVQSIQQAAQAWKQHHIAQVMEAFGCSAKVASDVLDELAVQDPEAVLPPEALSDEDADGILAAAAEADAAGAEGELEGDEGDEPSEEDLQDAIVEAINTMEAEGMPQEEIMAEVMAETGLTEEDMVETIIEGLQEQGLSDEDIQELADEVDALQAEGVTPEDLAATLQG